MARSGQLQGAEEGGPRASQPTPGPGLPFQSLLPGTAVIPASSCLDAGQEGLLRSRPSSITL